MGKSSDRQQYLSLGADRAYDARFGRRQARHPFIENPRVDLAQGCNFGHRSVCHTDRNNLVGRPKYINKLF